MAEQLRLPTILLDDYQSYVVSTRRNDDGDVVDWNVKYSELIQGEVLEFLTQHGTGSLLLMPPEFGDVADSPEKRELTGHMADELGDMFWFGFAVSEYIGKRASSLCTESLARNTGQPIDEINDFDKLEYGVLLHANEIKVESSIGKYNIDVPDDMRFTALPQNPFYVLMRMSRRLTRALDNGTFDTAPYTTTELEPLQEVSAATGDYLNTLAYIATHNLGWQVEDVIRHNIEKLEHRRMYGKQ